MKKIKATITPEQIQYLKNQTFSDNEPGTLLKDFSTLLDFIGSEGIPVSGKNHLIAIKLLPQLNQLMSHPLDVKLKRPQQKPSLPTKTILNQNKPARTQAINHHNLHLSNVRKTGNGVCYSIETPTHASYFTPSFCNTHIIGHQFVKAD